MKNGFQNLKTSFFYHLQRLFLSFWNHHSEATWTQIMLFINHFDWNIINFTYSTHFHQIDRLDPTRSVGLHLTRTSSPVTVWSKYYTDPSENIYSEPWLPLNYVFHYDVFFLLFKMHPTSPSLPVMKYCILEKHCLCLF